MSQTMLAIMAMMLTTLFALQQHRHVVQTQLSMIRTEVSTQATGVATDRLEEIGSRAFDENTKGGTAVTTALGLTLPLTFTGDAPNDDIDDFHGSSVIRFRAGDTDTLRYRIQTVVSYANEANLDQVSVTPTKFKKATVRVWSLDVAMPDTITLSQTYACGSLCNW